MRHTFTPAVAVLAPLALAAAAPAQEPAAPAEEPLATFNHAWEDDRTWHDGKAEEAVYNGTRIIYGELRRFEATLYTNREVADAEPTFTKSSDHRGRSVFKHHLREDVPTQNYDYHFSTMAYVGTEDFKSLKLDVGSIEDCGATFKQFVNHDGTLQWWQFSYFPDEGMRRGEAEPSPALVFQDALSVVLRGFPFEAHPPQGIVLDVLPDQTTNKLSPVEPVPMRVTYVGRETLDLPIGRVEAHHLRLAPVSEAGAGDDPAAPGSDADHHDYWFAAEGGAPWLHAMVQYTGPRALTYSLRSLQRTAYWEH